MIPLKLPEKYESIICWDVCKDDPNNWFQFFKEVSEDCNVSSYASQFVWFRTLYWIWVSCSDKATLSIYGNWFSQTTQHLKFSLNKSVS
mgnify:CR=1 FL=1